MDLLTDPWGDHPVAPDISQAERRVMKISRLLGGLALTAILTAGCGAKAGTPTASPTTTTIYVASTTTTTTISVADLSAQYLAAVAPYNAAAATFQTKAAKLSPKATNSDYANLAEPLAHASETLDQALLRLPWPATMKPDVNALVTADTVFESDLLGIRGQTLFSATAFVQQFVNDSAKTTAAVSIVRADLGLPPAKG